MKRFLRGLMVVALAMLLIVAVMPQTANAAEYWKAKYERFSAVAGTTLATGDAVYLKGSDGKAYKADADDSAARPAVGIIGKGGATNATVEIIGRGVLAGQTAASPGARLFLSTTAGALTATAPTTNLQGLGFVLPGTAASSTTYHISVVMPASPSVTY